MDIKQRDAAQSAMIHWLADPHELGKPPAKIECTKEFDLHGLRYYVFKYRKNILGNWLLGVCGGYEKDSLEHCGHVFSEMAIYNDVSSIAEATKMVEIIRAYWMEEAKRAENKQAVPDSE
jgi:hypothetical protein